MAPFQGTGHTIIVSFDDGDALSVTQAPSPRVSTGELDRTDGTLWGERWGGLCGG